MSTTNESPAAITDWAPGLPLAVAIPAAALEEIAEALTSTGGYWYTTINTADAVFDFTAEGDWEHPAPGIVASAYLNITAPGCHYFAATVTRPQCQALAAALADSCPCTVPMTAFGDDGLLESELGRPLLVPVVFEAAHSG
ncbi:hypothetical protein F8M49_21710 [Rhodococcus zopfii]|uniref:Uncharacterized protein n=1 Tax=Rhodococcus zopfii TaxID=43772 RepID=A0ABU3WTL4_9NOCA|nr:hypothetical protein [Rhodococcus zopfii]